MKHHLLVWQEAQLWFLPALEGGHVKKALLARREPVAIRLLGGAWPPWAPGSGGRPLPGRMVPVVFDKPLQQQLAVLSRRVLDELRPWKAKQMISTCSVKTAIGCSVSLVALAARSFRSAPVFGIGLIRLGVFIHILGSLFIGFLHWPLATGPIRELALEGLQSFVPFQVETGQFLRLTLRWHEHS